MTNNEKRYVEKEYVKDPCGQEIRVSQTGEHTLPELILKEHPGLREVILNILERDHNIFTPISVSISDSILSILGIKKEG